MHYEDSLSCAGFLPFFYNCSCQKQVEDNLQELVVKMADLERTDIFGFNNPEVDMDDHYYTTVGITLFQMVDENVHHSYLWVWPDVVWNCMLIEKDYAVSPN